MLKFKIGEILKLALFLILLAGTINSGCSKSTAVDSLPDPTPVPPSVAGKLYYVSASEGADTNTGLTTSSSFRTIAKAIAIAKPGDIVHIMNGTYNSTSGPVMNLKPENSGAAGSYITYKAYESHHPKITASGNVWNAISVNASYIVMDGLELEGNNANITYEDAYQSFTNYMAGNIDWTKIANFNTNGLSIGGPRLDSKGPHHIIVKNCRIHDFPGGGLGAIQADYITFEGNILYNNAWYMMYGGSGISILCPINTDAVTTYKNIIRGNICYNNKTTIPWVGITPARLSDGNGIIVDVNKTPYEGGIAVNQGTYNGRTLVENNLCYNNGGSGIHTYKASHVDIVNNTVYHNAMIMTDYSNLFANNCSDVKIANNIVYSKLGGKCNSNNQNDNLTVIHDYNIYFNGSVTVQGPHDKVADPQFVNLSLDPASANFALKSTSPAVNAGYGNLAPAKDITGATRPKGTAVDCGAYESY